MITDSDNYQINLKKRKRYFELAHFKYQWRSYQKRILDDLDYHMNDNALHIVAPPGSGKTILGLEVAVRLNKPTLILAPTLAIRDQWITKFREAFLSPNESMDWITTDIHQPKYLTIVTYQALHAVATNTEVIEEESEPSEEEEISEEAALLPAKTSYTNQLIKSLQDVHVGTIILDEAHHLKKEWWKTLFAIKSAIEAKIVALTATPPYDVTPTEWNKYVQLSGEVDEEIYITELVKDGNLCPHQDLIYLSQPTEEEKCIIASQREKLTEVFKLIHEDPVLKEAMYNHPFHLSFEKYTNEISNHPGFYDALSIYLNENNLYIKDENINIDYIRIIETKHLDHILTEWLLNEYLKGKNEYWDKYKEHRKALYRRLKEDGFIENGYVHFTDLSWLNKRISSSLTKLESIQAIVTHEYENKKQHLRMVILTDYVRKEFLSLSNPNDKIDKIGVIPIFETLRRNNLEVNKMGILTGSLVIIPTSCINRIETLTKESHEKKNLNLMYEPYPYSENFVKVSLSNDYKNKLVEFTTQLFEEGEIEVLIGTKSLLGEGWDAPSINSLVLATFVGSYMLSNQMRGRAIRSSKNDPKKTSNIWHLACTSDLLDNGGNDIKLLKKRFRSFVGLTNTAPYHIEKGIKRLMLPSHFDEQSIKDYNAFSLRMSEQHSTLRKGWMEAIQNGTDFMEFAHIPHPLSKEKYIEEVTKYEKKEKYHSRIAALSALTMSPFLLLHIVENPWRIIITGALLACSLINVKKWGSSFLKTLKYNIKNHVKLIATVLLDTMIEEKLITHSNIQLEATKKNDGSVDCRLIGGSYAEQKLFTKMLVEVLGPIDNHRYVIKKITKKDVYNTLPQKTEEIDSITNMKNKIYFNVPEQLALNKITAIHFAENWRKQIGKCELIYLKNKNSHVEYMKATALALNEHNDDEEAEDSIIERWGD